jgi:hypothetical protein
MSRVSEQALSLYRPRAPFTDPGGVGGSILGRSRRGCPPWCWSARCVVRRLHRGSELGEHRSYPETFEVDGVGRMVVTMVQRPGEPARLELRHQVWIDRPDVDGQQALARAVVGDLLDALRKRR